MASTDDPQTLEITALRSIYAEDFIECPPPKAWKVGPHFDMTYFVLSTIEGAAALREFIIRVTHPNPDHASEVNLRLRVKCVDCTQHHIRSYNYIHRFPKTYPRLACPTFSIEKPLMGITESQVTRLSQEINSQAQKLRGFEMVFSARIFDQSSPSAAYQYCFRL
jgi:translation initiation factor 2-alpha kinase 4